MNWRNRSWALILSGLLALSFYVLLDVLVLSIITMAPGLGMELTFGGLLVNKYWKIGFVTLNALVLALPFRVSFERALLIAIILNLTFASLATAICLLAFTSRATIIG